MLKRRSQRRARRKESASTCTHGRTGRKGTTERGHGMGSMVLLKHWIEG